MDDDDILGDEPDDSYAAASQNPRMEAEWATLNALRDTVGIAAKGAKQPTYTDLLALGQELIPGLFDPETSLVHRRQLSANARMFVQEAEATSRLGPDNVSALQLVQREIVRYESLVTDPNRPREIGELRKKLASLQKVLHELGERKNSEHALIFRDSYQVPRKPPIAVEGRSYRQYQLDDKRALGIRVLHPDAPEHATGADLLYETYWETGGELLVRLAAVQYKVWTELPNGGRYIRIDARVRSQLNKLESLCCGGSVCGAGMDDAHAKPYRLPYCAAYLRPTNPIQPNDARLISFGYYAPICAAKAAEKPTSRGNATVNVRDIRSQSVTHVIFEELFNTNMLGSRWLKSGEVEALYRTHKVFEPGDRIIIQAQEFPVN